MGGKKNDVNRRDFLAGTGGAIGLVSAAALGLPAIGSGKEKIEFVSSSCGQEDKDRTKILVAYASRTGSTGEVADAIGKQLCVAGAAVDVRLVKDVEDVSAYEGVVLGGPARNAKWVKEARDFVELNKKALAPLPVFYFITCLQVVAEQPSLDPKGTPPKDETIEQRRKRVKAYLDSLLKSVPEVEPIDIEVFAGTLHFDKLKAAEKTMMKSIGFMEGDFRDWKRIKGWATEIAPALML